MNFNLIACLKIIHVRFLMNLMNLYLFKENFELANHCTFSVFLSVFVVFYEKAFVLLFLLKTYLWCSLCMHFFLHNCILIDPRVSSPLCIKSSQHIFFFNQDRGNYELLKAEDQNIKVMQIKTDRFINAIKLPS